MKNFAVLLIAVTSLLAGCMVHDPAYRDGGGRHDDRDGTSDRSHERNRDGASERSHDREHDRDSSSDRGDWRPENPNRY